MNQELKANILKVGHWLLGKLKIKKPILKLIVLWKKAPHFKNQGRILKPQLSQKPKIQSKL